MAKHSCKPVPNWKARRRYGMKMTHLQFDVLRYFRDAKLADPECPFALPPEGVWPVTIKYLMDQDWLFVSPDAGLDQVKYYISDAGERALRIFEKPVGKRYDGICPNCGLRPVHISPSGRRTGYCLPCGNELGRRKYHHNVPKAKPDSPCPHCKTRPRHRLPGGKQITYCEECNRILKRRSKRKRKAAMIEKARRGELMCIRCKVKPRHCTDKSVYDYCVDCWHAYLAEYNDRRRPNSRAAKIRKANP